MREVPLSRGGRGAPAMSTNVGKISINDVTFVTIPGFTPGPVITIVNCKLEKRNG